MFYEVQMLCFRFFQLSYFADVDLLLPRPNLGANTGSLVGSVYWFQTISEWLEFVVVGRTCGRKLETLDSNNGLVTTRYVNVVTEPVVEVL